jgi:hypothetical protein
MRATVQCDPTGYLLVRMGFHRLSERDEGDDQELRPFVSYLFRAHAEMDRKSSPSVPGVIALNGVQQQTPGTGPQAIFLKADPPATRLEIPCSCSWLFDWKVP